MYEPVLTDEKLDLYNVYEVHENYRILAMAVNVPLQVAEEICHILNNFEPVILKTCPICDQSVTINEYISDYLSFFYHFILVVFLLFGRKTIFIVLYKNPKNQLTRNRSSINSYYITYYP